MRVVVAGLLARMSLGAVVGLVLPRVGLDVRCSPSWRRLGSVVGVILAGLSELVVPCCS